MSPYRPRPVALAIAITCALTVLGLPAPAAEPSPAALTAPRADAAPATLTLEARRLKSSAGEVDAEFGRLRVPMVRSDPDAGEITLAFVRLKSTATTPATPLVYLEGGPGGSSTWQAERPERLANWVPLLAVSDVILLDQRGTGQSEPDLRFRWEGEPPLRFFADADFALEHYLTMSAAAREAILARGVDPRGFTSIESADDIDDLRQALGLERISLFGFSYGTHLALATIRRHGDHVDNAILAGVEGPDHTWKLPLNLDTQFGKIANLVAQDPTLAEQVPDLSALLDQALARLADEPMVITLKNAKSGETFDLPVGPWGLLMILRRDIGDASDIPVFPRLLYTIAEGDSRVLEWFVRKRARSGIGLNGMSLLVDGASAASPSRQKMIEEQSGRSRFGSVANFPYPEVNRVWKPNDVGEGYRSPLVSDVRTLFLSGTLDWNSPPHQAEEIRFGFSDATHLIVANAGHEQVLTHPEIRQAMSRFLTGADVSDVHAAWPPLRFVPLTGHDRDATHPSVPRD